MFARTSCSWPRGAPAPTHEVAVGKQPVWSRGCEVHTPLMCTRCRPLLGCSSDSRDQNGGPGHRAQVTRWAQRAGTGVQGALIKSGSLGKGGCPRKLTRWQG